MVVSAFTTVKAPARGGSIKTRSVQPGRPSKLLIVCTKAFKASSLHLNKLRAVKMVLWLILFF